MRIVAVGAVGVVVMLGLAACGGEPSDRVAVPGAPAGGDTRPPVSTILATSTTISTLPTDATSTTIDPPATAVTTTSVAPESTTTVAPPPTTVAAAPTTTVAPPPVTTVPTPTTTELVYTPEPAEGPLRIGVEGPRSLQVQQQLIALAILPSTAADSKYGPGTAAGVRRFQESKGLVVDGVAGPNTLAALAEAVAALTPPTTAA